MQDPEYTDVLILTTPPPGAGQENIFKKWEGGKSEKTSCPLQRGDHPGQRTPLTRADKQNPGTYASSAVLDHFGWYLCIFKELKKEGDQWHPISHVIETKTMTPFHPNLTFSCRVASKY